MKRQSQKGHPDAFDLAWLDDEELHKLQEVMQLNRENHICGYWLHCLTEQLAIRAGKLRIMPGAEARDPDLKQYPIIDLHAARLIFRAIGIDFKATGKPTASAFVKCWFNVAKARWANNRMDLLGLSKFTVRLTRREAIVITVFFLLTWFVGYVTGAEVTRIGEKSAVIHDCIFLPAPENSSRV